jgi:protein gp37
MVKKPSKIFTCSMGDLFGDWVSLHWIKSVLISIKLNPQHQFQILTKNPIRMALFRNIPANAWLGTSIDGLGNSIDRLKILSDAPFNGHIRFASFEPLLADVVSQSNFTLENIDWVIVGAQTGPKAKSPEIDWISDIGLAARKAKVPVFLKDNLPWPNYSYTPGMKRAQEFPTLKGGNES